MQGRSKKKGEVTMKGGSQGNGGNDDLLGEYFPSLRLGQERRGRGGGGGGLSILVMR